MAKVPQARVARAPVAGVTAVGAVVVTVQEMAAAMMGARLAVVEALMVRTKGVVYLEVPMVAVVMETVATGEGPAADVLVAVNQAVEMVVVLEVAMGAATVEPMGAALEELTVVVEEVEKEGDTEEWMAVGLEAVMAADLVAAEEWAKEVELEEELVVAKVVEAGVAQGGELAETMEAVVVAALAA